MENKEKEEETEQGEDPLKGKASREPELSYYSYNTVPTNVCSFSTVNLPAFLFRSLDTMYIYVGPHVTWIQGGLQCPSQGQNLLHLPKCTMNFHIVASIIFLQSL